MPDPAVSFRSPTTPRVEYCALEPGAALGENVLAAITFGAAAPGGSDPRLVRVGLAPLHGAGLVEVWHAAGPVRTGAAGSIRYAADADYLFAVLEIDERAHGGMTGAAEAAYAAIRRFQRDSSRPHLLRVWNYFDAINRGAGDEERYKQFCIGRSAGFGAWSEEGFPAATVIGRRDDGPTLQVYWLAGRAAGTPVDNPRQTQPNRYPREYGPRAPQFSRAMLIEKRLVAISGTASIVGHASHHPGDLDSQLTEVLENLGSVLQKAAAAAPGIPPQLGAHSLLKIYLRDVEATQTVEAALRERLPAHTPRIILAGDVCRADLLVEADGVHAP